MPSNHNYISPPYCQAKMYDDRITCCPLVSHGEYDQQDTEDRQTEGCQAVTMHFPLDVSYIKTKAKNDTC